MTSALRSISALLLLVFALSCRARLTVMSFNVRQSHAKEVRESDSWTNRKEACLEMLKTRRPDLVGFQEAQYKGQWSWLRDTLASEYGSYGLGRRNGADKGECMGILYRKDELELLDSGTFWQSETPDTPSSCFDDINERSVSWAVFRILKNGKKFFFVNTHMGLSDNSRSKGMEVILKRLPELNPESLPVIITGDFTTTHGNFIFKELLVPGVINNLGSTGNAVFCKIKFGHSCIKFLPKEFANNIAHSRRSVNENEQKNKAF